MQLSLVPPMKGVSEDEIEVRGETMVSSVRLTEGGPEEFHALMSTRFSCS